VGAVDVITNSGHLRPLDRETVNAMNPAAVIPLMYESWELRPGDVSVEGCKERGIRVAGTNERHPNVDVFSYLGLMAVKILMDAGVAVYRSRLVVVCDNAFAPFIQAGLMNAGASVELVASMNVPTKTYKPGESFSVEPGKIHEGINNGTVAIKALASFVTPKGAPLTTQVP